MVVGIAADVELKGNKKVVESKAEAVGDCGDRPLRVKKYAAVPPIILAMIKIVIRPHIRFFA